MRKLILTALFVSLITLSQAQTAFSLPPAVQKDFIIEINDNQYVFVMLGTHDDSAYTNLNEDIRAVYRQSGLYKKENPLEPLWTVDWYAEEVFLTNDGKHLLRLSPFPYQIHRNDLALQFYSKGRLVKQYRAKDLAPTPIRFSKNSNWISSLDIDEEKATATLITKTSGVIIFDMTTGEIISSSWWKDTLWETAMGLVLAAIAFAPYLLYQKMKSFYKQRKETRA